MSISAQPVLVTALAMTNGGFLETPGDSLELMFKPNYSLKVLPMDFLSIGAHLSAGILVVNVKTHLDESSKLNCMRRPKGIKTRKSVAKRVHRVPKRSFMLS